MQRTSTSQRRRRGVAAVEGSIVLLATLLLVFGGLDLGLAMTRYNALGEAACRAARAAAVRGSMASNSLGPTTLQFTADADNAVADAFRFVLPTMDPSEVTATVEWPDGGNDPDDRVQVTLQYTHHSHLPLLGLGDFSLESVSVMAVEH